MLDSGHFGVQIWVNFDEFLPGPANSSESLIIDSGIIQNLRSNYGAKHSPLPLDFGSINSNDDLSRLKCYISPRWSYFSVTARHLKMISEVQESFLGSSDTMSSEF